jgi:branched-chain amino acid transport system substrate-binding protein
MEICGIWRPSSTANDVSAELNAVKDAGAHIMFTLFTGPVATVFGKQWGELEIPASPIGTNAPGMTKDYWRATGGKCEYECTLNVLVNAKVTGKTLPFYTNYVKTYKDYPYYTAAACYDGLYVMKETIERAQTLDVDVLVAELENTDYLGVGGRIQYYPRGHSNPHDVKYGPKFLPAFIQQWRNGELVTIFPDGGVPPAGIGAGSGWEGLRFEGTVDYELPPFMVKYWKGKK